MIYLLDSVILIDHFNGVEAATNFLRERRSDAAISAITRAEVLTGFDEAQRALPARLLDTFVCLQLDQVTADLAARLRRKHHWKLPDAIQAAVAQHHGLKLVTRNIKDFPPSVFDFVLTPYSL
ncbi:tRNA(fMet)-specific endonuclease VapC [Ferrovum myxofaciens]|uniref:tRNA(FMet)-specific endonuclease VapC n=1 Tax=Ferrovum myxofaciens TaxID=416213 RepID=A0A149VV35_9PROT|nr:PIN domain-containing protein [Ferrovum myxofaciens]KXW57085.1 tRNA(fMet)-specific endonuclease VapC [Ferrovum myxofaciens]